MINLLPPAEKQAITFARYNTQLRSWIIGAFIGLAGAVGLVFMGQMYLQQNTDSYRKAIDVKKERLEDAKQTETLAQVKGIQESYKLVVDVLSREVLFSKLLPRVGAIMPAGTVLEDLSLNTAGETTAFDLKASAKSYQAGTQVQANLQDKDNKLFEKADLVTIACATPNPEAEEPDPYPCEVQVRVQPAQDNEFLLLPNQKDTKQ